MFELVNESTLFSIRWEDVQEGTEYMIKNISCTAQGIELVLSNNVSIMSRRLSLSDAAIQYKHKGSKEENLQQLLDNKAVVAEQCIPKILAQCHDPVALEQLAANDRSVQDALDFLKLEALWQSNQQLSIKEVKILAKELLSRDKRLWWPSPPPPPPSTWTPNIIKPRPFWSGLSDEIACALTKATTVAATSSQSIISFEPYLARAIERYWSQTVRGYASGSIASTRSSTALGVQVDVFTGTENHPVDKLSTRWWQKILQFCQLISGQLLYFIGIRAKRSCWTGKRRFWVRSIPMKQKVAKEYDYLFRARQSICQAAQWYTVRVRIEQSIEDSKTLGTAKGRPKKELQLPPTLVMDTQWALDVFFNDAGHCMTIMEKGLVFKDLDTMDKWLYDENLSIDEKAKTLWQSVQGGGPKIEDGSSSRDMVAKWLVEMASSKNWED